MNKNKSIFWIATGIIILWEGIVPLGTILFAPDQVTAGTRSLGYPDYFAYTLVVCKIIGVIAISFRAMPTKVKEWAYAGLTFNLIFAFISHALVDQNLIFMIFPLVVLAILVVSYTFNNKIELNS